MLPGWFSTRAMQFVVSRLCLFKLAAAAVIVAATAAAVVVADQAVATAVAQQQDDQDDPANITAAETVVTHNQIPPKFIRGD